MSEYIAVDIALLLNENDIDQFTSLIEYEGDSPIRLNANDCLPHISLAMGVISKENFELCSNLLEEIVIEDAYLAEIVNISSLFLSNDEEIKLADIKNTNSFLNLHENVMGIFSPIFKSVEAQNDMFVGNSEITEFTKSWVNNYEKNSAYKNFDPHITLGIGKALSEPLPINLKFKRLAMCQLGNYCTCREILTQRQV